MVELILLAGLLIALGDLLLPVILFIPICIIVKLYELFYKRKLNK